jgi:ribosomal protein S18 acetylase RimI-like enzyme
LNATAIANKVTFNQVIFNKVTVLNLDELGALGGKIGHPNLAKCLTHPMFSQCEYKKRKNMKDPDSNIDKNAVQLRVATQQDVENLVTLLNRCYRSDEGWTNEAALIGGIRTTAEEMTALIDNPNVYLFVFENPHDSDDLLGCISVDFSPINHQPAAYIGTFAVHPAVQGKGIGDTMLSAVETFAIRHAHAKNLTHLPLTYLSMSILSHRPELLSYYQRRGYLLTGERMAFPRDGNNGDPKRDDVFLEFLQKPIQANEASIKSSNTIE